MQELKEKHALEIEHIKTLYQDCLRKLHAEEEERHEQHVEHQNAIHQQKIQSMQRINSEQQTAANLLREEIQSMHHSNSKKFDCTYRYDRFRIAELANVICRDLESKPASIDRNRIFNCVKSIYDDFQRSYANNPEHMMIDLAMLLHICHASSWFSYNQREKINQWKYDIA